MGSLSGNATSLEKLKHDDHVGSRTGQFLHKVFQERLHQLINLIGNSVDGHIAEKDGIGPHPEVVLELSENDLLPAPTMLQNPLKPGMLLHGDFTLLAPKLLDKVFASHA